MKKTKKVKKTIQVEETVDIICNKCGKSCAYQKSGPYTSYYGLVETEVHGGYDSSVIGDMTSWRFSLCEVCLGKIAKGFKIPVEIKDSDISDTYLPQKEYLKKRAKALEANKQEWIKAICEKKKAQGHNVIGLSKKLAKKSCLELSRIFYKI